MTTFTTQSLMLFNSSTGVPRSQSFGDFVMNVSNAIKAMNEWVLVTSSYGGYTNSNHAGGAPPATTGVSLWDSAWEIWRFNDVLHMSQSAPVFVRVEYGISQVGANYPGIALTAMFETGSAAVTRTTVDGVSRIGVRREGGVNSPISNSLYTHYFCCVSGSDFGMIIAENLTAQGGYISIERTKDINGNPTNEGVVVMTMLAGLTPTARAVVLHYSNSIYNAEAPINTPINHYTPVDTRTSVGFWIPVGTYGFLPAARHSAFIRVGDLSTGTSHTFLAYGVSSSYYCSANTQFNSAPYKSGVSVNLLMRYE
jgi:hypothetical protein